MSFPDAALPHNKWLLPENTDFLGKITWYLNPHIGITIVKKFSNVCLVPCYGMLLVQNIFRPFNGNSVGSRSGVEEHILRQVWKLRVFLSHWTEIGRKRNFQRSPVRIWLLSMCREVFSAKIVQLMFKCLWSGWKW